MTTTALFNELLSDKEDNYFSLKPNPTPKHKHINRSKMGKKNVFIDKNNFLDKIQIQKLEEKSEIDIIIDMFSF
jgi:hypothetical protein